MCKVYKLEYAINHSIAEGDEGINTAERYTVDELLNEFAHKISLKLKKWILRFAQNDCVEYFTLKDLWIYCFFEFEFAVFNFEHNTWFYGIALTVDSDAACNSFEIFCGGKGFTDFCSVSRAGSFYCIE